MNFQSDVAGLKSYITSLLLLQPSELHIFNSALIKLYLIIYAVFRYTALHYVHDTVS